MQDFPVHLKPENKSKFPTIRQNRLKLKLRRELYDHIISHSENEYFSLDKFNEQVKDMNLTQKLADSMITDLEKLGWKCKKSYGDTALFIYSTENPPPSCW